MKNYITLEGKRYATLSGQWSPATSRPVTVRRLLSGRDDVTFGPMPRRTWDGTIVAQNTPQSGWGSVDDLRAAMSKLGALSFVDHFDNSENVVVQSQNSEASVSPMWDAPENEVKFSVSLVKVNL